MSVSYGGDSITFADGSTVSNGWAGFKNRIINGDMKINQRAGGTVTVNQYFNYITDRWCAFGNVNGKYTAGQSTTAPAGFTYSLLATSSSAYTVSSGDVFNIGQYIEGLNVSDLAWGTASASPVTLSFWVRSSLTGTFGGALRNSAENRSYPFTYTINQSNTFEYKTITVPGDTTGTWLTDTGIGIRVIFGLGVGSSYLGPANSWAGANYYSATGATSLVATSGATFYITGVQLEKGSTASSYEYRPFSAELTHCQRYFEMVGDNTGDVAGVADGNVASFGYGWPAKSCVIPMRVTKRASPTVSLINYTGSAVISIITGYNSVVMSAGTNSSSYKYAQKISMDSELT